MWDLIRSLRDRGTTVVLVTHFLDEAETLCDRVMVMRRGRFVADGTPAELVAAFGDAAVVSFTYAFADQGGLPADEAFGRLPGLKRLEQDGDRIRLHGSRELIAHAGAALVAAGAVPADLSVEQPGLEHVLLPILEDDG